MFIEYIKYVQVSEENFFRWRYKIMKELFPWKFLYFSKSLPMNDNIKAYEKVIGA